MTGTESKRSRTAIALLVVWLAALSVATLRPAESPSDEAPESASATDVRAIDRVANVGLYVPGGVLAVAAAGVPTAVVGGAALSAAIEAAQATVPGRWSRVEDVVANTAGALVGALLWIGWRALRRRPDRMASRLEIASACVLAAGHLAALVLWSPSPAFSGGHWSSKVAAERRLGLPADSARQSFEAEGVVDGHTLLTDSTAGGKELVRLYASGDAVVLRARVLARDLGFLQRSLRMEDIAARGDGASGSVEEPVAGVAAVGPARVVVRTTAPSRQRTRARWSVDDLWALVVPAGQMGPGTKRLLQWSLTIALTAPIFLFAVFGGVGAWGLAARGAVVILLVTGAPILLGQPLFDARLYAATGLAVLCGVGGGLGLRDEWLAWTTADTVERGHPDE